MGVVSSPAMRFEHREDIAAASERVWAVLAELASWPEWTDSIDSLQLVTSGGLERDAQVRIKQPKVPVATWTVTSVEPGRAFTWVATGPGVRTTATHTIDALVPAGSAITLTLHQGGIFGGLVGLLTAGLTKRYLAMEARGLKARAESMTG